MPTSWEKYGRNWYLKNRERIIEKQRERRAANPIIFAERNKRSKNRSSDVISKRLYMARDLRLRKKYGLKAADVEAMIKSQDGKCAICGRELREKSTAVDHCHQTGIVRGILCSPCNTGIGQLQESEAIMLRAIDYLKTAHRKQIISAA